MSPATQARLAVLQNALIAQEATDAAIADISSRAMKLSPDDLKRLVSMTNEQLEAEGWTRDEVNVAGYALLNWQSMPAALRMAHDRHITRLRVRGEKQGSQTAQGFVIPSQEAPAASTKALEPEDPDE